jgi:hypothetical protein
MKTAMMTTGGDRGVPGGCGKQPMKIAKLLAVGVLSGCEKHLMKTTKLLVVVLGVPAVLPNLLSLLTKIDRLPAAVALVPHARLTRSKRTKLALVAVALVRCDRPMPTKRAARLLAAVG